MYASENYPIYLSIYLRILQLLLSSLLKITDPNRKVQRFESFKVKWVF